MSLFEDNEPEFYTIGYEGLSLQQFVQIIKEHNIKTVVDIRISPWSRDPTFSKSSLQVSLPMNDLKYEHLKEWGNPKRFWGKPDAKLLYQQFILPTLQENLEKVKSFDGPVALMCMEKDPRNCHRTIVANELTKCGYIGKSIRRF
jgi:uncharacterized protein (DUF488 family)